MTNSKKLVFFGNERLATGAGTTAPTLRVLIAAGYEIEAVIASHEDAVSRQKRDLEIGPIAQSFGIPVILPGKNIPLVDKVKKHQADAAVLVAYGKIIPQEVIDMFPAGIINIHPSLLPKYRGPTPIENVILDGAAESGVSLMKLSAKMDAGPIYAQEKIKLSGDETKQELADKLIKAGSQLLIKHLPDILDGSLQSHPQDETQATYTKMIRKENGKIDLQKTSWQLEKELRAYAGWPQSRTKINGHEVIITKAHAVPGITDEPGVVEILDDVGVIMLHTKEGYLCIDRLKPAGKKDMSAADFLRGYSKAD